MENFKLANLPISLKLFITGLFCLIGLSYLALLTNIWLDTQMNVSNIIAAYSRFEFGELADHSHKYLPYYTIYLFFLPVLAFMLTSYSEKIKRFFAVVPILIIVIDIGSMWLIRYIHAVFFSWILLFAGTFLGMTFLSLFLLVLYDVWIIKKA